MPRAEVVGECRLCGKVGRLSKEHIPAKGAFKGRPYKVRVATGMEALEREGGQVFQRGYHAYVLCDECNQTTGAWYGDEFAKWSRWGFQLLDSMLQRTVPPVAEYTGYPLRIAKQVVSTMIASSAKDLTNTRPDLAHFVLEKEAVAPAGFIRLSTYLCPTSTGRSTGVACALKVGKEPHWLVEFALPPFGYVLTLSGEPFDPRPVDISWFTACQYGYKCPVALDHIPTLPTHQPFPGDYRSRDEIRRDYILDTLASEGHTSPDIEAARILAAGEGPAFMAAHGEQW